MKVSQIILPEIWNLTAQNIMLFLQIVGLILVWAAAVIQLWQFSHSCLPGEMSRQRIGHQKINETEFWGNLHNNPEPQHCPCCVLQPVTKAAGILLLSNMRRSHEGEAILENRTCGDTPDVHREMRIKCTLRHENPFLPQGISPDHMQTVGAWLNE